MNHYGKEKAGGNLCLQRKLEHNDHKSMPSPLQCTAPDRTTRSDEKVINNKAFQKNHKHVQH